MYMYIYIYIYIYISQAKLQVGAWPGMPPWLTLAPSHLPSTAALAGAAAKHAARLKHAKYAAISAFRPFGL